MFKINDRVKNTIALQNIQFNSKINVLMNFNHNKKLIFIVFCLFSICYYSFQNFENDIVKIKKKDKLISIIQTLSELFKYNNNFECY